MLSTRITIVSNELPRFTDASDALASRMLILELTESWYGKEDTLLSSKLLAELPSILHWAIDGWVRLRQREHFVQPSSSAGTVAELIDLGSPVAAWIRERCETGSDFKVNCTVAYSDFRSWAEADGHQHKATQTVFGRDLKAIVQAKRTRASDGLREYFYTGLRMRQ